MITVTLNTAAKVKRKALTASERTSLLVGRMCSVLTKGSRGERISFSSSTSKSLLFTPLLFTLWAVPLNRLGSGRKKKPQMKNSSLYQTNIGHIHTRYKCAFNRLIEEKFRAIIEQIRGKYRLACRVCNIVNVEMVTLRPDCNRSGNLFTFGRSVNG